MDNERVTINIIKKAKNNDIFVITPLKTGHKISRDTRTSIQRNDVEFNWISIEGNQNRPKNLTSGLDYIKFCNLTPKYILPLDNNILLGRHYIDRLYTILEKNYNDPRIAYCYGNLEYKGAINTKFLAEKFNIGKLLQSNYISSNSMFRYDVISKINLETDSSIIRLEDWAYLLKLLKLGYVGVNCSLAYHIAQISESNTSAKGQQDYLEKYNLVKEKFVNPVIEMFKETKKFADALNENS